MNGADAEECRLHPIMRTNRYIAKRTLAAIIAAAAAGSCMPYSAFAEEYTHVTEGIPEPIRYDLVEGEPSEYGLVDSYYVDENGNRVDFNLKSENIMYRGELPASYDLRDYGRVASVKNQQSTGTCWAHALVNTMESSMITKGYEDNTIDYSESHLVWFSKGKGTEDTTSPIYGDGEYIGLEAYDSGGNVHNAVEAFSRGNGIQLQANAPEVTDRAEVDESQRYDSYARLVECIEYDVTDRNTIKYALQKYGSLYISYVSDDGYTETNEYTAFYHPTETEDEGGHAVSIVGWDDNFAKENFVTGGTPESDGAWICKNSWGENWGDGGYFYMSYEEPSINKIASLEAESAEHYDTIYQYDGLSGRSYNYGESYGVTGANIFTAERDSTITSVSFYTTQADVDYRISVYTGVEPHNPMSGTRRSIQSGTKTYAGFYNEELIQPVVIKKGEAFSIVVEYLTGSTGLKVDYYTNSESGSYMTWNNFSSTTPGDNWIKVQESYGCDVCIKAHTVNKINIDEYIFPDAAFREYVYTTIDTDGDGMLSDSEIAAVKRIEVIDKGISDLTGIEYFTELTYLDCNNNALIKLDVSKNTKLSTLFCYSNKIEDLNISGCTAITALNCEDNELKAIDVSHLTELVTLKCARNNIEELNISSNTNLNYIACQSNDLMALDISNNDKLTYLDCGSNNITELDLSGKTLLHTLYCSNNDIKSLDIPAAIPLKHLECGYNDLTELDVSNKTALSYLSCEGNYISNLNMDGSTNLRSLYCYNNRLPFINLENFTKLNVIIINNNIVYLENTGCNSLNELGIDIERISNLTGATLVDGKFRLDSEDVVNVSYTYACSDSKSETFTIDLKGITHEYTPSDNKDGLTHNYTCSDCGLTKSENHIYGDWRDTNEDNHNRLCTVCNYEEFSDHRYEDVWTIYGSDSHTRNCLDCGHTEKTDHVYSDWTSNEDGTHSRTCTDCGYVDTADHVYSDWTSNEDGTHSRTCTDCGYVDTADHVYSDWTANEDGTHSRTCTDCGYVDTVDHVYSDWTSNEDGTHSRTCTDCGYVDTADHVYSDWTSNEGGTHSRTCTDCGYVDTADHMYSDWTANEDGTHSRTCTDCGYVDTVDHVYGDWTSNEGGTHSRTCTDCGYVDTADHVYGDWTANEDETHSRTCTDCGYVDTADHVYSDWTANEDGTHSRTCITCDETETEAHSFGAWTDMGGATEQHTCSDCGKKETRPIPYTLGDINNDNRINVFDLVLIKKALIEGCENSGIEAACDVNMDGEITMLDIVRMQKFIVGQIETLNK